MAALLVLLLAAVLGGYLYERHRTGSIYHPHARFVPQPTPTCPRAARNASPGRSTATPRTTRASSPPRRACTRPFKQLWVHNGQRAARVPAGDLRRPHLPARRQRRAAARSTSTPATRSGRAGSARCPPRRPRSSATTVYATLLTAATTAHRGRVVALNYRHRRHPLVARAAEPQRVLAAARPRQASSSAPRTAPSTRSTRATARHLDLPRARRGQGQPDAVRRRALLRRLLRPRPGDLRADRPAHLDQRLRRRAARQRHLLLDRRRHLRARLPRQHRRAHLRLRRLHRQARLGRADRRLRLRLARRHQRARPRPDDLPRLLRRHLLRAQRPLGPDRLELRRARARSPARRRSSGASSTSPTSASTAPTASASPPAACSSRMDTGSFDPVDQRRPEHLPDRLHRPVRARAAADARSRTLATAASRRGAEPPRPERARQREARGHDRAPGPSRGRHRVQPPGAAPRTPPPLATAQ